MEQCFKIALWMFVLIGSLQAKPVCSDSNQQLPSFNIAGLGFKKLKNEVTCGPNVTFTTPKNVLPICHTAALELFIEGLEQASRSCTDANERVESALESIRYVYPNNTECTHPTQCAWDDREFGRQYADFLDTFKLFLDQLNSSRRAE